jgi:glyoxylase I family protein
MAKDDSTCMELTAAGRPVIHIHHLLYACWDSEQTRHFYEEILGMPLFATVVIDDPDRDDGSAYCYTFFKIGGDNPLVF